LALMYFYISTSRRMCAVPNMAVFCSFLTSWFPGMVLTYFLNDFEMVPVAPIITYYYYYYYYWPLKMCKSIHCYLTITCLDLKYNRSLDLWNFAVYFYLKQII
jgi:hypothetical protein